MAGTKPAGEAQYAATSMSSNPGGRNKTRSFDTSVGATATTVAENATVNACAAAQDAIVKAARAVLSRRIGLARTVESGGQVLAVELVSGGSGYSFTSPRLNVATTGGAGTGLTLNYTRTTDVVDSVSIGNSAGRGYAVGDLVTSTLFGGTGVLVQITAVA